MKVAYVDTSCLAAIAFDEPEKDELVKRLQSFDRLISSNLLEAELLAALVREGIDASPDSLLANVDWLLPDRSLGPEFKTVLAAGHTRGADLWHLACALYLSPKPNQICFMTLDKRQGKVARKMGFRT